MGAITDARSLAKMYAAALQAVDGVRLMTAATRARATAPGTDDVETLIDSGTAGPDIRLGLADPEHSLGFGYIGSRMRDIGPGGDARCKHIIDAITTCP